uniref:Queuine tRNA-ribosyltransferase catalytic subunit 1 n=1 Tax=Salix viminalis TaxID=40686 RepID=A0A6N2MJJ4_SALVM
MALYTEHQVGPRNAKTFPRPQPARHPNSMGSTFTGSILFSFSRSRVFLTENILNRAGPPRSITKERQRTGTAAAAELGFALWRTTFLYHTFTSFLPAIKLPLLLSIITNNLQMALRFEVLGRFNRARAARLTLPHFVSQTPLFMPVGTQGTIKGLTTNQLEEIGCQIILGNTYHLALRPTSELIDELGGLHKFMNWPRAMLTDSGGFQMVSLLHLADITEKGVTFQSPVDGKPMLLTPEESIQIQNRIGADIIMALDDVVKTTITGPRIEEAMYRTLRWIDRCIAAHKKPNEQNLFGIVQGGLDPVLSYAIGGLAGGEDKDSFWRVVAQCTALLPEDKPRYVMGVGYPLDIVVCSALGADLYDCVYPTRTARFGTALNPEGVLKLKHKAMAEDTRPIDPTCSCMVCKNYTRAYIHCLVTKDAMGSQLLSYHNLHYMLQLSRDLHSSIIEERFPDFVRGFLQKMFPKGDVPEWVCNAMEVAGIKISSCCAQFSSSHYSELEKDAPTKKFDDKEIAFDDKYTLINKFDSRNCDDDEVAIDDKYTPTKYFDEVALSNKNNTKQEL